MDSATNTRSDRILIYVALLCSIPILQVRAQATDSLEPATLRISADSSWRELSIRIIRNTRSRHLRIRVIDRDLIVIPRDLKSRFRNVRFGRKRRRALTEIDRSTLVLDKSQVTVRKFFGFFAVEIRTGGAMNRPRWRQINGTLQFEF